MKKYKRIALFVGHSKLKSGVYTSADGRSKGGKLEYFVNKELAYEVKKWLEKAGQPCDVILVNESKYTSSSYEDDYKLPIANNGKYDLIVEFHCNSFDGKANGAEVLYNSNNGKIVAQRVQNKLKTMFTDRGVKYRDNLYMLTRTKPVAIMLETLFCDNKSDCSKYDKLGKSEVGRKIAEGLIDAPINPKPSNSNKQIYYRVVVGSYEDKTKATKVMEDAKKKGFDGVFLTTYTKEVE